MDKGIISANTTVDVMDLCCYCAGDVVVCGCYGDESYWILKVFRTTHHGF